MPRQISLDTFEADLNRMIEQWVNDSHLPLVVQLREPIARGFADIFNSRVDSRGDSWPDHAASTIAQYGPHPLLRLSDTMYRSLTTSSGDAHYELLSDTSISWGTTVVYASKQNFGEDKQNIPAREFCYWSDNMINESMKVISAYIDSRYLRVLTRGDNW